VQMQEVPYRRSMSPTRLDEPTVVVEEGHLRSSMKGAMSMLDSDETPRSEVKEVLEPPFATVWRGYDPSQVSGYLKGLAGRLQVLENYVSELESELEQARGPHQASSPTDQPPGDPYEKMSDHVAHVMRSLDRDVQRIRQEAQAEAKRIVDEAKAETGRQSRDVEKLRKSAITEVDGMLTEAGAEADRIRVDAQAKAEDIRARAEQALEDARAKVTEVVGELDDRRRSLITEIRSLHARILGSAKELEPIMDEESAVEEIAVAEDDVAVSEEADETAKLVSP
jgi:cell division septum initiation protein DivIVA